jgi:hypothetical protein
MTWYKKGLRFKCTGCGACCTKEPGYVWLSAEEIEGISTHLNISKEEFLRKYTRSIFGRISLLEHKVTYDCVFLKDSKCTIYSARPKQCRTFPWWKENLETPEAWKDTARRCEGIDHPDASVVSFSIIEMEKH